MNKKERHFKNIAEFKQRFANTSTGKLQERLSTGSLQKEAAIAIREIIEERESDDIEGEIIYVALLDEGTSIWRPVKAKAMGQGAYKIVSKNRNPEDEFWQFPTGSIIYCEKKTFSNGETGLVAVELKERFVQQIAVVETKNHVS